MIVRSYAAVLIDFDGTLVDSEPKHCQAHQRQLANQGIHITIDEIMGNVGKSDRTFYLGLMERHGKSGDVDAWMQAKTDILLELYRTTGLNLRPGVRALLDHARSEGLCCCVVTSTERRAAALGLELCGLSERLPMRVCYEDVSARKPDPAPYLLAARRLSVPIEHCLVIEDSVSGVTAGHAAGAPTVALLGHAPEADLVNAGAMRCVGSLEDLIPINPHQAGGTTAYRKAIRR
jgi:HAD superfamily hydrolase (TIGR01509 family)